MPAIRYLRGPGPADNPSTKMLYAILCAYGTSNRCHNGAEYDDMRYEPPAKIAQHERKADDLRILKERPM